ncbi:AraC family transcriptional regulator [Corallococcus sp. CA053C]|uniref:helix-turn-helix domain-containing protein n=1 Tax=Corallococcus sp. CA053C TaxID=2316732 RepID=UPI000EA155F9|nr:AraC family transcriptional regulator [Corallococcus sp. CA053C]RKH13398.1 AraC family transcriptional regulator [Corallococcus sp. CA053C]
MPHLTSLGRVVTDSLHACLVACDGVDAGSRGEGLLSGERIWFVLRGRFRFQSARVRCAGDPATVLFTRDREPHRVLHHDGGDVCLTVAGALASTLVDGARPRVPLTVEGFVRLHSLARQLRRDRGPDPLAVEEQLCTILDPGPGRAPRRTTPRQRRMAETVAEQLALRFDERLSLTTLAAPFGVSVFSLCRAFSAVHGVPVHRMQQRLRLRHALSWVLDTAAPFAQVAAECGFASHAHLCTQFRREFGLTPSAVRRQAAFQTCSEQSRQGIADEMGFIRRQSHSP